MFGRLFTMAAALGVLAIQSATAGPALNLANSSSSGTGICRPEVGFEYSEQAHYRVAALSDRYQFAQSTSQPSSSDTRTTILNAQSAIEKGSPQEAIGDLTDLAERAVLNNRSRIAAEAFGVLGLAYSASGDAIAAKESFSTEYRAF